MEHSQLLPATTRHTEGNRRGLLPAGGCPLLEFPLCGRRSVLPGRRQSKQAMRVESMAGYPGNTRVAATIATPKLNQFQTYIKALTQKMKELTKAKAKRYKVWCTNCKTEGHHVNKCHLLHVGATQGPPVGPSPGRPSGGVSQVASTTPFQHVAPFQNTTPFKNAQ